MKRIFTALFLVLALAFAFNPTAHAFDFRVVNAIPVSVCKVGKQVNSTALSGGLGSVYTVYANATKGGNYTFYIHQSMDGVAWKSISLGTVTRNASVFSGTWPNYQWVKVGMTNGATAPSLNGTVRAIMQVRQQ